MTAIPLLAVDGLAMRFGAQHLFNGLDFTAGPGAVALVGPNGTGKSTLLTLLAGITTPQAGTIRIAGHALTQAPREAKQRLAYVPDESVAYDFMTGAQFLGMVDALRGTRDLAHAAPLIAGLGLTAHMGKRFAAMSLGTRKKFMLAAGLMGDAPVVLMDEPTNGIDAAAKAWLAELIRQQGASRLLLFSTHDNELIEATGARLLHLG
ncbi:ABC transporter ATP-binding protein [[Empedobacter] haloabium]|uniref:ABC transporter ATP-binding protein n=1 Tax=[Empedobacter] haloabium TaxID=592317 RepID=A0ABZ1UHJ0_9BURK